MQTTGRANGGSRVHWIVAAMAVTGVLACPLPHEEATPVVRNDCQQDQLLIRTEHDSVTGGDLPLVGPIADLPEYHDCQRFVIAAASGGAASGPAADSLAYGPLVAIWAANRLDSTFKQRGALDGNAIPVAVIYDFEPQAGYAPLHIEPGFSCLYLWKDTRWNARLLPVGPEPPEDGTPTQCLHPVNTNGRDTPGWLPLEVLPATLPPELGSSDIPPVVRWDWDQNEKQQYISIRCGDEWCHVGAPGFRPAESEVGTAKGIAYLAAVEPIPLTGFVQALPNELLRVTAITGWYDRQRLDERTGPGKDLVLTAVEGTAFPHPALGRIPDDAFSGAWIPAAYLDVSAEYQGKVALSRGITRVALCRGAAELCEGAREVATCPKDYQDPADPWWARMVTPTGETTIRCVRRRGHGGRAVPAAATRWNWSEVDAKTWIACSQGCCVIN